MISSLSQFRVDSAMFLEFLNGGAITPELLWMLLIGKYLHAEARRRGLHGFNWLSLPPNMNFMLAIFICDTGVWLRSTTIWAWRFFGAGDFGVIETSLLVAGGALIFIGYLCKIRALTYPEEGRGPWVKAAALSVVVLVAMVVFR